MPRGLLVCRFLNPEAPKSLSGTRIDDVLPLSTARTDVVVWLRSLGLGKYVCAVSLGLFKFLPLESTSYFGGSLVEVGGEAGSVGSGCTVVFDREDGPRVAPAREGASSALMARTSRAISKQVSNSV